MLFYHCCKKIGKLIVCLYCKERCVFFLHVCKSQRSFGIFTLQAYYFSSMFCVHFSYGTDGPSVTHKASSFQPFHYSERCYFKPGEIIYQLLLALKHYQRIKECAPNEKEFFRQYGYSGKADYHQQVLMLYEKEKNCTVLDLEAFSYLHGLCY